MDIIIFIVILSFLVIIHELGHYLVARRMGVKVEEFGLGYPPRAILLFKKWGTNFSLNWIPFGGFVKMKGEFAEETATLSISKDSVVIDDAFSQKAALPRLAIILAGATVNFIYGILAFSIVFSFLGIPVSEAIISEVQPGSPAEMSGITPQLQVTSVTADGISYSTPTFTEASEVLKAHAGQTVTVNTLGPCDNQVCSDITGEYKVQLRSVTEVEQGLGALGIVFETRQFYPWYEMPLRGAWFGLQQAVWLGIAIFQGLGSMVADLVTKGIVPKDVAGPVGIVHQAQENGLFRQGLGYIVLFSGMISINLAIMNVLPIPALDGGRALFIILEKLIGKKKVAQVEGYANYGGFALLIVLIVLVTARDVMRILTP